MTLPALLGLTPRLVRVACAVFVATTALLFLLTPEAATHWQNWIVFGCIVAAGVVSVTSIALPLPATRAWLVTALCIAAATQPFWDHPVGPAGYAPWYLRAITEVAAFLILRGRWAAGWFAVLGATAVLLGWTISAGENPQDWSGMLLRQITTVGAVQVLVIALGRAARTIATLRERERTGIEREERRAAALGTRRTELTAIRRRADPLLHRIAAESEADDPGLRSEAAILEAELRDLFRGRRLAAEPLADAARNARGRGIDVVLLDDLDAPLPDEATRAALSWASARMDSAAGPSATIRLSGDGQQGPAITFISGAEMRLQTLEL